MPSDILPPNPCLLGILLVVKVNSGPKIVFHYPPKPGEDNSHFTRYLAAQQREQEGSSSTDDNSTSSHEEVVDNIKTNESKTGDNTPELDVEETGSISPDKNPIFSNQYLKPKWNDVFGLPSYGLARLLTPPPTLHKKRFELSIDDKVFVGHPVFAGEGDEWEKKKAARKAKARKSTTEDGSVAAQDVASASEGVSTVDLAQSNEKLEDHDKHPIELEEHKEDLPVNKDESNVPNGQQPLTEGAQAKAKKKKILNMFHVVFVLNPPPLEYHLRVKELYDHVIKKFSKALKLEQARSNYVVREISAMSMAYQSMKKAQRVEQPLAPLYHQYLSQSPLAKAIAVLYDNISASRIALVNLTPSSSLWFQTPVPTSISVLPGPLSPQMPGLWLTTAASLPADDDVNMTSSQLASHFTLLLLYDLPTILSDINGTTSPISEPLTHYLRVSKPTKSFLQISQASGIPLPDIQFLASHLIYRRKARAIPPLHQRDTYIVSPNADMSKVVSATSKFAKVFPALPPLPKILNLLSTPRAYVTLIPSKDHKEAFMNILGWLMRDGWVTQLRTFAWVRVPGHVKAIVDSQGDPDRSLESSIELPTRSSNTNLAIPQQQLSSSPTSSTTSTHTAIPPSHLPHPLSPPPSLITNPRQASGRSSRYLAAISSLILKAQGVEAQKAWNRCLRYFDGEHAVEAIAVGEGWKRKREAELVAGWEAEGFLCRGRHW
ncbi:MAG: hypothetical protein L6R37_004756 [Teloschistes peruensis]|nr:MAG: hypothetical protein L6R37_004756 [Teloschistes peruensis]